MSRDFQQKFSLLNIKNWLLTVYLIGFLLPMYRVLWFAILRNNHITEEFVLFRNTIFFGTIIIAFLLNALILFIIISKRKFFATAQVGENELFEYHKNIQLLKGYYITSIAYLVTYIFLVVSIYATSAFIVDLIAGPLF